MRILRVFIVSIFALLVFNISASAKIHVVTTTFILSSIVKQIGGRYVDSSYLIPSGSNPHVFSPRPKSLMRLAKADLFVGVGFGFEFWIDKVGDLLKNKEVLFLSDYYKHPIDAKIIDNKIVANPHIWLDLQFMANNAIYKINDKLCSLDVQHCSYFKENTEKLNKEIMDIRDRYISTLKSLKNCCFVDIKPAFEYLLKSVGQHSCSVLIKKGNEEPKISDIKQTVDRCRCSKGLVLYISNYQLARMIADKLNYSIVNLNPLGSPKDINSYPKLLLYNLNQIEKAFK